MANPIQQGLKPLTGAGPVWGHLAAMANPIQQGLKPQYRANSRLALYRAAMANPIQQGLKQVFRTRNRRTDRQPQWLIQYNKD